MELTTRGRYAVMALADLARFGGASAVSLTLVAERQSLPLAYLEQLFVPLRRAGLVESARGRTGGYRLAHPASGISIAAIMSAVEEATRFTRCATPGGCQGSEPCIAHDLWTALSSSTADFLASVSLDDVISGRIKAGAQTPSPSRADVSASRIYLDYNATAPLKPQAKLAALSALECAGNASSVHAEGRRARALVETAREQVAALVNAKPSEIVFTSGATEANAWAMAQGFETIFAGEIEHESVLAPARAGGADVIAIPVRPNGLAAVEAVADAVLRGPKLGRALVTLQMANNETGVVQPVAELAAFAREHGLLVHTDAVQAAGRLTVDFKALGVDTLALSAHKMGGPKGAGALVIRDGLDLVPLIRGGGQERRRRSGTENIAAIAGFGAAAVEALRDLELAARLAKLRDQLEAGVRMLAPEAVVLGSGAPRLPNTACIAFPGHGAESTVIKLDLAGIAVSAGAACSSGKVGKSHVLEAMHADPEIARSGIRVSLGPQTSEHDIAAFLAALKQVLGKSALAA